MRGVRFHRLLRVRQGQNRVSDVRIRGQKLNMYESVHIALSLFLCSRFDLLRLTTHGTRRGNTMRERFNPLTKRNSQKEPKNSRFNNCIPHLEGTRFNRKTFVFRHAKTKPHEHMPFA
jgi:UDP-N-acetylglucosamine pyrophosphorylase